MINDLKRGRVVILTTHLMDEADTLGDRIGIMSKGKLVALGNALHLKKKFGGNYKVTVTPADKSKVGAVKEAFAKTVPGAVREASSADDGGQPIRFVVEPKDFANVPALFEAIDALVAKGAAKDWGLSQTSLEDVFVGLDEQKTAAASASPADATPDASSAPREAFADVAFRPSTGKQVRALLRKSLTLQVRQRKTIFCQCLIPLGLVGLMLYLYSEINSAFRRSTSTPIGPTGPTGPITLDEPYWIGAYMSELSTVQLDPRDTNYGGTAVLKSMYLAVAVTEPGLKDKVGMSCGSDVYGTFNSSSAPEYKCDPCQEPSDFFFTPHAAAGLDGENVTFTPNANAAPTSSDIRRCPSPYTGGSTQDQKRLRHQCRFTNTSDPLSISVASAFSNDAGSGLLKFFPARLVSHRWYSTGSVSKTTPKSVVVPKENITYMRDTRLCAVELAPLFKAPANDNDISQAINDLLVRGQLARTTSQAPFDKPVSLDFAGWQRAQKLVNAYFPDGALVFDRLSSGRVSFTYQSYYLSAQETQTYDCTTSGGYSAATVSFEKKEEQKGLQAYGCSPSLVGGAGLNVGLEVSSGVKVISSASFVLNGITSAMLSQGSSRRAQVSVGLREMPGTGIDDRSSGYGEEQLEELTKYLATLFVPLATTFLLPVLVFHVVYEKEAKLRATMLMMGLKVHIYWLVQYLFDMALAVSVLLIVYFALAAGQIPVYTRHSFGIVLLLFLLWANAMVALSFLLSVAFSRTRNANIALYMLVFIAVSASVAMQIAVLELRPNEPAPALWIMFPPFAYYRGNYLLASRTYTWATVPGDELQTIFGALVLESIVCFLATYYLDQVLPKEYGVRRHPLFCVRDPLRAAINKSVKIDAEEQLEDEKEDLESPPDEDADVAQERRLVLSGGAAQAPIRVVNIKKRFGGFQAVDGVTLHFEKGCSAMLGPNGAGKSTVISMLTGLYRPSAGDAFIAGHSVCADMQKIYQSIGVCPQHDVTYADLNSIEHLLLYARLKGVDAADERRVVVNALNAVMLKEHAYKKASQLSGGQRRRLSIAIAFIGNPAVVFLDEVRFCLLACLVGLLRGKEKKGWRGARRLPTFYTHG
jgi:ABC-type multidrug transport system ATPase subunit